MRFVKNIFTVSFFAIMVVAGARADIVSKTNIVAGNNVTISKPTEGANSGKIVISSTDTKYTLPDATANIKGGVRVMTSGGGIEDSSREDAKVPTVAAAWEIANIAAGAAVGDYALQSDLDNLAGKAVQTVAPTAATPGKYVTNLTKKGTTVTATTAYVQIPVGSATAPTSVASVWIE